MKWRCLFIDNAYHFSYNTNKSSDVLNRGVSQPQMRRLWSGLLLALCKTVIRECFAARSAIVTEGRTKHPPFCFRMEYQAFVSVLPIKRTEFVTFKVGLIHISQRAENIRISWHAVGWCAWTIGKNPGNCQKSIDNIAFYYFQLPTICRQLISYFSCLFSRHLTWASTKIGIGFLSVLVDKLVDRR